MARINSDVIIALLLLILCAFFFAETFSYERANLSIIGSKLWPRIVVLALGAVSMLYLIQSLRHAKPAKSVSNQQTGSWWSRNRNVIGIFALYAVFLYSLPTLGMLLAGILFVFAVLTLIGPRDLKHHLLHAAVAVIFIGSVWAVFRFLLGVILPEGQVLPRF